MAIVTGKRDKFQRVAGALRIGVLNLMPNKEQTEDQYRALFSPSPTLVDLIWIQQTAFESKNVSKAHLEAHYMDFKTAMDYGLDGLIVTGAPIEHLPFEEVYYWGELQAILDLADQRHLPTLLICWASQAGLYHFHKIQKYDLPTKMFGVFDHKKVTDDVVLEGLGLSVKAPHSRYTYNRYEDIAQNQDLKLLLHSSDAGVFMVKDQRRPIYYLSGHMEYDLEALHREYQRDLHKGLAIDRPKAYYVHNDPHLGIEDTWCESAAVIADRWLKTIV